MNPLWLLLIVPGVSLFTICIMAMFWAGDDSDARMIALLKKQYDELQICPDGDVNILALRHDAELREIEG